MPTAEFTAHVAEPSHLDTVIRVCLDAFADEAVMAWVMPDAVERQSYMRESFTTSLESAVAIGAVILAVDHDGTAAAASIWIPHSEAPATPAAAGRAPTTTQAPAATQTDNHADPVRHRLMTVEAATRTRTPAEAHMHLTAMATRPGSRGLGAGTVMLTAGLNRSMSRGLPAYLEASTVDNQRLYARFGFDPLGDAIHLPDDGPTLQPMWRGLDEHRS